MNSLTVEGIVLMAICFAIGAAAAWLLAVALYPTYREVRPGHRKLGADDRAWSDDEPGHADDEAHIGVVQ